MRALPAPRARALVDAHDLRRASAPRLAVIGWSHATLPGDNGWLPEASRHAWPEVRAAALERVASPCAKATSRVLATTAGPRSGGGDPELVVGRAAIRALGRCADDDAIDALQALLENEGVQEGRRLAAAIELLRLRPASAAELVGAWIVSGRLSPSLMAGLVRALGDTPVLEAPARQTLCDVAALARGEDPRWRSAAAEAHRALARRFPGASCPT
jgi:hypothetical protein